MPQQDQHGSELDHAEEIGGVPFPSRGESAEVLQPGEQPFKLPAAKIPPQWSAILSFSSFAPIGSDHFDAMLILESLIQRIAVVGFVADQSFGQSGNMSLVERVFDQRRVIR